MNISVRKTKDVAIVDFAGRLAVGVGDAVLPAVVNELLDSGFKKILLNLSDMDYIDSNGLGELVQSLRPPAAMAPHCAFSSLRTASPRRSG